MDILSFLISKHSPPCELIADCKQTIISMKYHMLIIENQHLVSFISKDCHDQEATLPTIAKDRLYL